MGQRTALYDKHLEMQAKMVDFGGWDMPLHYGSQLEEHHTVRKDAGMFDVSHMVVTDLKGEDVADLLRLLMANNIDKLKTQGKALYTCMLNAKGGVIDDLIIYYMEPTWYRIVSNAATHDKDLAWIQQAAREYKDVSVTERDDLAMIAVQGPNARAKVFAALGEDIKEKTAELKPFHAVHVGELFVATTGYTGEDGFEIVLPNKAAGFTWQMLAEAGVAPIGLGARDTLRLEAGMCLYGSDMDETTHPLESGLSWTVAWEPEARQFVGRKAIEKAKSAGISQQLIGLVLHDKGVLRSHQIVECGNHGQGEITSGGFSPSLQQSIALARLPANMSPGDRCSVEVRGKKLEVEVVKFPFVRNGKSCLS